jgi:hypothetical protein
MTDLTAARNTPRKLSAYDMQLEFEATAAKTMFQGGAVAVDTAGTLVRASDAAAVKAVGRGCKTLAPSVSGDRLKVDQGIFGWVNNGLTDADRFKPVYFDDDNTVSADSSKLLAGYLLDVDGTTAWVITVPGLLAGLGGAPRVIAGGAAYTVRNGIDHGVVIETATDNHVTTLPDAAAANKGQEVTLQFTGADGAALVTAAPHSSDGIFGTVANAAADSVSSGTVNKPFNLTKATSNKGDYVKLRSDGSTGWYVTGGVGIWASTP